MLDANKLAQITAIPLARAEKWITPLNDAMEHYRIDTRLRVAAFIAQVAHESGSFRYVKELGSSAYLDKYDQGTLAARLGNTPEDDDDGQKYCGRGLIQITGHDNYAAVGKALSLNTIDHPELLEQPQWAALSAAWFWDSRSLNALADQGEFEKITRRINGGVNGLAERKAFYSAALSMLK